VRSTVELAIVFKITNFVLTAQGALEAEEESLTVKKFILELTEAKSPG